MNAIDVCELCEREKVETTEHHLTPREEGGAKLPTAWLCAPCHKQVHALYSNKELAIRLSTLQTLKADEKIAKYLKFIRKQAPGSRVKTKRSNEKPKR